MNFQNRIPDNLKEILRLHGVRVPGEDYRYFAWPQEFPSTAGPSGGIGGQALSTFTVEAYNYEWDDVTIFVCGDYYKVWYGRFEPFAKITGRWMRLDGLGDNS